MSSQPEAALSTRNITLERPLVFFDLETTGRSIELDRIVQIGMVRVEPDGATSELESLVNPQMHISLEATGIHTASATAMSQISRASANCRRSSLRWCEEQT